MKIYIVGTDYKDIIRKAGLRKLISFAYKEGNTKGYKDIILDSGAFTMFNKDLDIDYNEYIKKYAKYILKHDIDKFFELDIYTIIGTKATEDLRYKLEKYVGKKSIPVWHKVLGIDYFKDLCDKYDYIAIGGFVTKEISIIKDIKYVKKLLKYAKSKNVRVHGLGIMGNYLKKFSFHSVDSSNLEQVGMWGGVLKFTNGKLITHNISKGGKRTIKKKLYIKNVEEMKKFANFAEKYL